MFVCATSDATDDDILEYCNAECPISDPGWSRVVREPDGSCLEPPESKPQPCSLHSGRVHYLVSC